MAEAYIVDATRTPFGTEGGAFRDTHPQDLAAAPLSALEQRNGFDGNTDVEDVLYGCVSPVGEQGLNVGRLAPMVAGWGEDVPGVQVNRMCGSSQQALAFAAGQVRAGFADILVAGGVEHMTRVPMNSDTPLLGTNRGGIALSGTYLENAAGLTTQHEGAERIAERWEVTRREADELAADSQKRWASAADAGQYDNQVVPVEVERDGQSVLVEEDEHPRPDTDIETLAELPLAFRSEGAGVVTAGNASGIADGASAVLVASGRACEAFGWDPLARIVDVTVVGTDPVLNHGGSIPATQELLAANDLSVSDIDRFEINESFAPVVAAWLAETGADWDRTNVWGGAIAHGHPLGATSSALVGKLAFQLDVCGGQYGLATTCISFGQAVATLIET